jgi:hypothetical protein
MSLGPRNYLLNQYRQLKSETASSPERLQELQRLAADYDALRNDIAERSRLHGLDTGADMQLSPRELSRRAAARAGLQLPDLDPELEKDLRR